MKHLHASINSAGFVNTNEVPGGIILNSMEFCPKSKRLYAVGFCNVGPRYCFYSHRSVQCTVIFLVQYRLQPDKETFVPKLLCTWDGWGQTWLDWRCLPFLLSTTGSVFPEGLGAPGFQRAQLSHKWHRGSKCKSRATHWWLPLCKSSTLHSVLPVSKCLFFR